MGVETAQCVPAVYLPLSPSGSMCPASTLTCAEGPVLLGEHTGPARVRKADVPDPTSPCLCFLDSHLRDLNPKFLVWGGATGTFPLLLPLLGSYLGSSRHPSAEKPVSRERPTVAQGGTPGHFRGQRDGGRLFPKCDTWISVSMLWDAGRGIYGRGESFWAITPSRGSPPGLLPAQ